MRTRTVIMMLAIWCMCALTGSLQAQTWVAASNGNVPANAFVASADLGGQSLYVCRTTFQGQARAGKVRPGLPGCQFEWNGTAQTTTSYEVLTNFTGSYVAVPAGSGTIPPGAVAVGTTNDNNTYACLASYNNLGVPGLAFQGNLNCYFEYASQGLAAPNYSVLVSQAPAASSKLPYARTSTNDGLTLDTANSLNPGGTNISLVRAGTGDYGIRFVRATERFAPFASAVGSGAEYCKVYEPETLFGLATGVRCYNSLGQPSDSRYAVTLLLANNENGVAFAYISGGSVQPNGSWSPSGAISANQTATGEYTVSFAGSTGGAVPLVNSEGFSNTYCYLSQNGLGTYRVSCRNPAGQPTNSNFIIAVPQTGGANSGFATRADVCGGSICQSFTYNSAGGAVSFTGNAGTGSHVFRFTGLNRSPLPAGKGPAGMLSTNFVAGATAHCSIGTLAAEGSDVVLTAFCFGPTGVPVLTDLSVFVTAPEQGTGGCTYQATPAIHSPPANGGSAFSTITTQPGCLWTNSSQASWISVTPAFGAGPGTAAFTIQANNTGASRTGTASVAGQIVTFTQASQVANPVNLSCSPATGPTQVGAFYTTTCTASGGTPPYTLSLDPLRALPPGLVFAPGNSNAFVSGIPTQNGSYDFGVVVTDAANATRIQNFSGVLGTGGVTPITITYTIGDPIPPPVAVATLTPGSGAGTGIGGSLGTPVVTYTASYAEPVNFLTLPSGGIVLTTTSTVYVTLQPAGLTPGTYNATLIIRVSNESTPRNIPITVRILPAGTSGATSSTYTLPQFPFGGNAWYSAIYLSNPANQPLNAQVDFFSEAGQPIPVPLIGIGPVSSRTVALPAGGTVVLEAPNNGPLVQAWAKLTLPAGVVGYGVFRQSAPGRADQEAVVPLTPQSTVGANMIFDDTTLITAFAILNPAPQAASVDITAYGQDGNVIGIARLNLPPGSKQALVLRSVAGMSAVAGQRGRLNFRVTGGALSVLGLRFGGEAFTSILLAHN